MEFILEIIIYIVAELILYLFEYPGAAIRWLVFLGRKPYKTLLDDGGINAIVFMLLIGIVIALIYFL